jgi:uncharacterized protein (TIGR02453 family)
MAFKGWPAEAIEFFEGLEADNSKAYWLDHKAVYDNAVKGPMNELLAELAPEFGEGRIFRPNRDIRFSADKSPYKTNIAATLGTDGYLHLSSAGLGAGRGMYVMANDQLDRYRQALDRDTTGVALADLVSNAAALGITVSAHDTLKTAPKGYPKDHPRIDLLRQKGLICWQDWKAGAWLGSAKAKTRLVEFLRRAEPISSWLDANVGPSTMPEPARR